MRSANLTEARRIVLPFFLTCLPMVAVYSILYRFAVNIPLLDDYNATLRFLLDQHSLPGAGAKLLAALRFQHGEYKLYFEHLLFAAWYALTGSFSFRVFITLGNLSLLLALWALWHACFASEPLLSRRLWLFLPVALLLVELSYAELLDWAMASLSAFAVVPLALLSLHLLSRPSRLALATACLVALLACGCSSSAFLLAPAGLIALGPNRNLRRALAWCLPFALALVVYLDHYTPIPHTLAAPRTVTLFFLSFLGGAVENMHRLPLPNAALALGTLLLLVVAHSAHTRFWHREPALFALAVWVLLTAALAAAIRSDLGAQQSLASRYKIYCVLLLIYSYAYLVDRAQHSHTAAWLTRHARLAYTLALAAALCFSIAADVVGARFLARRHDRLVVGLARYRADPGHLSPLYAPDDPQDFSDTERTSERRTLTEAIRTGIYRPPPPPPAPDHRTT